MHIVDVWPTRGMFRPGEPATFTAQIESIDTRSARLEWTIVHLAAQMYALRRTLLLTWGSHHVEFTWTPPPITPGGYGVHVVLFDEDGTAVDSCSSAFDVHAHWTQCPRYGFVCDFAPDRQDMEAAISTLARYHINGLQFYDWQYRHDTLLASTAQYVDPLGRKLSLDTVAALIHAAHRHGMAAMPYLAIYAASVTYWQNHLVDALYDVGGTPLAFGENFLGLMNPAPGSRWTQHLLQECAQVLGALPFDGLHVDQYGEPKAAYDSTGSPVDLPGAFVAFIGEIKQTHPEAVVLFNAVGNWPTLELADSAQDFAYIEVWPPAVTYRELADIVQSARRASGGKPVVIALYLPAERLPNIRLADALIFGHGGSRIELGEAARLLTDPYFPNHQPIGGALNQVLRQYYDFYIRYVELIGPHAADAEVEVTTPPGILSTGRHSPGWLTLSLVNFTGIDDPRWDEPHQDARILQDVGIRLMGDFPVRQVYWASPDQGKADLVPAFWQFEGGRLHVSLPVLQYWSIVAISLA